MKSFITTLVVAFSLLNINAQEQAQNSKRDEKFVLEAGLAGIMEIKTGELAMTNASSAQVRELAQTMIADHTLNNEELKAFADRKNMFFPSEMNKMQQKAYYKLSKLQGTAFDKKYTKCLKKAHKKAICKYKKASKKATDPELKSWAAQKLPQLEHHLEMVKTTCKMLH